MLEKSTKNSGDAYKDARKYAAMCNDLLNSREGAAEITGIERTRLARIELGSKVPYPEEILLMADAYSAPELKNHYCMYDCPIGKGKELPTEVCDIKTVAIEVSCSFRRPELEEAVICLLCIARDGEISNWEIPKLLAYKNVFKEVGGSVENVKLLVESLGLEW